MPAPRGPHPRHRVVLLGSASPGLVRQISESLTGPLGVLELAGISLFEEESDRLWVEVDLQDRAFRYRTRSEDRPSAGNLRSVIAEIAAALAGL